MWNVPTASVIQWGKLVGVNLFSESDALEEIVRSLEVVVDDDQIVRALLRVVDFFQCRSKTFCYRSLCFGAATLETGPKARERRRGDEQIDGIEVCFLDLPDTLRKKDKRSKSGCAVSASVHAPAPRCQGYSGGLRRRPRVRS